MESHFTSTSLNWLSHDFPECKSALSAIPVLIAVHFYHTNELSGVKMDKTVRDF